MSLKSTFRRGSVIVAGFMDLRSRVILNEDSPVSSAYVVTFIREGIKNPSDTKYFINVDGIGHWIISDKIAFYNFPDNEKIQILKIIEPTFGNLEGEQWPMGLHYPISFQNIPCITFSAGETLDIHHTPYDQFLYLNPSNLEKVVIALRNIISSLKE